MTTTYVVDENRDYAQVLEERDGSGNLIVRYVYGHDLISQTRGGATQYYHYDGPGSTRALTNNAEAITDTYNYDAFGNLLDKTGATTNNHLYTGEFFDTNIGFYYLRARYMSSAVGRFISMDTFAGRIRDPYSLHKYLYADANPVRYRDPSGYLSSGRMDEVAVVSGIINTLVALAVLSYNPKQEIKKAQAYHDESILAKVQTEVQIDLEIELEEDSRSRRGCKFFRGLNKRELKDYYDYGMIFANGVRKGIYLGKKALLTRGPGTVDKLRTVLTKILRKEKFHSLATEHADNPTKSPFVGVTTKLKIAKWYAHNRGRYPSGRVLNVKTKRAIKNPYNQWEEIGSFYKDGDAEWLVPLFIVRYAETIGEPYRVSKPKKSPWEP